MRYRSPLRSPPRSPPRSPFRSPLRSPPRSPLRSPPRSPLRSPLRSPRRSAMRSPPPRAMSPHRYPGVYDELLSPPRRNVDAPYGARYGPRSNAPPPIYPNMGVKPIPPLSSIPMQVEPPPGYRGRYDAPPFEDIPPGLEPAVPGFEPSPFEKPPFGPPGLMDRERIPPPNYRDPYRAPFVEGLPGYRDMSLPPAQNEIPVHVGDPPRYRESYRPGHPYRDQGPVPYRDGQPFRDAGQPPSYREPGFRGGPPPSFRDNYRNAPFREGGFRDNPPHGFREGPVPFRPPSVDPRDAPPGNYHDPAFRDGFRDENNPVREVRPGYRSGARSRGSSRRNPNLEHDRHREREGRDRYGENREPIERAREIEKRPGREDRSRDDRPRDDRPREERLRDHERNREYEKDRERDPERSTPDKKIRGSPKRSRETREKRRSDSRGRSRDRDRDGRRDKKEERVHDKTSSERTKEHKEKEKKLRDKKKKKREKEKEKEKDTDKKKKREKKDKKDKESVKNDDGDVEKPESKENEIKEESKLEAHNMSIETKSNGIEGETPMNEKPDSPTANVKAEPHNDLYSDEAAETVDKEIIQNYLQTEENKNENTDIDPGHKDEPFDGIELQINAEDLDLKTDIESTTDKEMLAPLPELSKWEVDDDNVEKKEPGEITSPEEEDRGKVTSEVLKRAENAIFAKAINSLRPIEIKKISSDRIKLYDDDAQIKNSINNIQITVPVADSEHRSIEINEKKKRTSKTPPPKLSVKERLGGKVEDVRRMRELRIVQSTVERVKSRSKTPKKEQPYRRVTVDRDRTNKLDSARRFDPTKVEKRSISNLKDQDKFSSRSPNKDRKGKVLEKNAKEVKKVRSEASVDSRSQDKKSPSSSKTIPIDRERKKSTLDEAHFEPDYDETVESDHDGKDESIDKKRERSLSQSGPSDVKKPKLDDDTIKLDLTNVKKKPDTETESSSGSEFSSSSSSSDTRKRKKKKKRSKKKRKRAASESESESDSDSDDHKRKKKKRKHKKKSSKRKKKSKHK